MKDVKWIKLYTSFPNNRKIKQLMKLPNGPVFVCVWVFLICLAGDTNENGSLRFTDELPYTDEMLADQFDLPIKVVRQALQLFVKFEMLEIIDDAYQLRNWKKYQAADRLERIKEQDKDRAKAYRERKKLAQKSADNHVTRHVTHHAQITDNHATESRDKNIDLSLTGERSAPAHAREEEPQAFGTYKNVFLTASEIEQLQNELPDRWEEIAQRVSTYKKQTGKSYASDFATIRRWAEEDADNISETIDQLRPKRGSGGKSNAFSTYDGQREYTPEEYDELELAMRKRRAGAESEGEE